MKYEKVCPCCGTVFETDNSRRIYCGKGCRDRAQLIRRGFGKTYVKNCSICGKEFDTGSSRRNCYSRECAEENQRRKAKEYARTVEQKKRMKRLRTRRKAAGVCTYCGERKARAGHYDCEECAEWRREYYRRARKEKAYEYWRERAIEENKKRREGEA